MAPPRPNEVTPAGRRVAVIAGPSGTLRESIVQRLLGADWAVAACDSNADGAFSPQATILLDTLDRRAVAGALATIEGEFGAPDALILLPPTLPASQLAEISTDAWIAALRAQVLVAANFAWACVPSMVSHRAGNIIAVTSDAALGADGGVLAAAASGAMLGFAKALAIELAKTGVQVNAVCAELPGRRPSDLAETVLYLAGETHFFLGQVLSAGGPS